MPSSYARLYLTHLISCPVLWLFANLLASSMFTEHVASGSYSASSVLNPHPWMTSIYLQTT